VPLQGNGVLVLSLSKHRGEGKLFQSLLNIAKPEGNWLILYFYPKDDTPGCTAQAKEFSRLKSEFEKAGARIYGVNTDSPESHQRFIKKHNITVSLLSDPKGIVAKQFGVNITMGMCSRDTVVVDSQGKIFRIFRGVNPKANPTEILSLLREK